MDKEKIILVIIAVIPAIFNFFGIWQNNKLAQKLKNSDKDDNEKRELRTKIHDSLTGFEEVVNSKEVFSDVIAKRLKNIARRVKLYDPYLSDMINVFVTHWKGYLRHTQYTRGEIHNSDHLVSFSINISNRADELITKPSFLKLLKSRWSWLKFRIKLFKKEPSASPSASLPLHRP